MDVVMPQMGESIAQGTITKWYKAPGDTVEKDETLFEIATDKVDAEIPSPSSGTLAEILVAEGATVDVGVLVARLDTGDGTVTASASTAAPAAATGSEASSGSSMMAQAASTVNAVASSVAGATMGAAQAVANTVSNAVGARTGGGKPGELYPASAKGIDSVEELRRSRSTPVVRNIATEHGVALADVPGTGISGRVTKKDILSYIEGGGAKAAPAPAPQADGTPTFTKAPSLPEGGGVVCGGLWAFNPGLNPLGPSPYPTHGPSESVEIESMSSMRKGIAKHMVASKAFSAHVEQMIEIDFTAIDKVRNRLKASYAERGMKLTYNSFILYAAARALRQFPQFNVSVDGENIIKKKNINLGVAVSLDWGLLVPVIKNADELNLAGLTRASSDLAGRARNKKLKPDEVAGGTFTVTNPGVFGVLCGNPIINQPQVAILGCGAIEKRAVVVNDAIAIRKRCYFTLTIDHRVLDGADGARFLKFLKDTMEAGDFGE